jgi:4-hydroxybenzoate polyprenyltransferase
LQRNLGHGSRSELSAWLSAVRVRQWSKNLLVFLPVLLSHQLFKRPQFNQSLLAFVAFCLCASSAYIINDLADLQTDKRHPKRRTRPFASGRISPQSGAVASCVLLVAAVVPALQLGYRFQTVLALYYILTWMYSKWFRSIAIVDVMTLAGLYAARIVGGSAATAIPLSYWFLALATFMFLSLAIVKRYAEIRETAGAVEVSGYGRGYDAIDLPLLPVLGVAAGYCSVLVLALYISSTDAIALYRHREALWLVCPLAWFWITRIWRLATRGDLSDDPVAFATTDATSVVVLVLMAVIVMLSI